MGAVHMEFTVNVAALIMYIAKRGVAYTVYCKQR